VEVLVQGELDVRRGKLKRGEEKLKRGEEKLKRREEEECDETDSHDGPVRRRRCLVV
jgi:hypothetical protein